MLGVLAQGTTRSHDLQRSEGRRHQVKSPDSMMLVCMRISLVKVTLPHEADFMNRFQFYARINGGHCAQAVPIHGVGDGDRRCYVKAPTMSDHSGVHPPPSPAMPAPAHCCREQEEPHGPTDVRCPVTADGPLWSQNSWPARWSSFEPFVRYDAHNLPGS